jgi:DNA adenine methylase
MDGRTPHLVQYMGSKRALAQRILEYAPRRFDQLMEPFAGMAAVTIAAAKENRADCYHINDVNVPIVRLLQAAIDAPGDLAEGYAKVWGEQFRHPGGHVEHFCRVRDRFNAGGRTAEDMLYLLARCVKGSVRYGKGGNFNQSPDKRRHGTNPQKIAENAYAISALLKGKSSFSSLDYRQILEMAGPGDVVYMDPPYQGVSGARDNRYLAGVDFNDFADSIEMLDERGVAYIISYDGECGGREYGSELPARLNCTKFLLNAGPSTQATLLGRRDTTFEALYVCNDLVGRMDHIEAKRAI